MAGKLILNSTQQSRSDQNMKQTRNYRFINVHPISGALGAEIKGVNIALPLKREVVLEIRQAFLDHLVIFFHNQELTTQEQLAFSRQFGQPMGIPTVEGTARMSDDHRGNQAGV